MKELQRLIAKGERRARLLEKGKARQLVDGLVSQAQQRISGIEGTDARRLVRAVWAARAHRYYAEHYEAAIAAQLGR